ncbi:MAG: hypothetical protein WC959_12195 [Kiritimatiellales bacterium]
MSKKLKLTDKEALRKWDDFKKQITQATAIDPFEDITAQRKRIAELEAAPEKWFAYYFPHYYKSPPAKFHLRATRRLLKNKRWYEVRAWSRELAKSVRSMFEVIYLALTGDIKNMLLISNSGDNAERLLTPFRLEFESNQRIRHDYGNQQKPGSWESGEFTLTSGVSFRSLGAGQSPRGTRNEAYRPDFILVDDIDTDEETRNPDRIQKKWEWIEQALIPTVSISGNYRIIFNGNIIAKDCCITRAIERANHTDIVNIRGKNGKSSWPEKNSEQDIDEILSKISTASGQKEYFNNPVSAGDIFTEMHWGPVPPLAKFRFLIAYGDPAPSNSRSKQASYKSLFLIGIFEGKFYVITGYLDKVVNDEFVNWYYYLQNYVNYRTVVYNYIENNKLQDPFYEQVFIPLFSKKAEKHGVIGIQGDDRKKPDKFSRIEGNLEPINRQGLLILNEKERNNPHMVRLEEQFLLISPRLPAPADGPDCIEGGVFICNQKIISLNEGNFTVGVRKSIKKF